MTIKNSMFFGFFSDIIKKIGLEQTIINFVIVFGIILIYTYVIYNFINARKRKDKKKREVRSVVETASMSAFFMVVALVVNYRVGIYHYHNVYLDVVFLILYLLGLITNLLGRYYLGNNWGNNVIIYENHTLVTKGVYRIVRHPLYASIIWMIYAVGVLKCNYLVFILNTFIFIPFMYYRAKQEETELKKVFKEYDTYISKTGMFFPNLFKLLRKENSYDKISNGNNP